MPQSSITDWLSRSAAPNVQKPAPVRDNHGNSIPKQDTSGEQQDERLSNATEKSTESDRAAAMKTKSSLIPNVELRACTKDDILHFKRLNSLLLPIPYPESFYREIMEDPLANNITLVAVWHDDPQAAGKEKGRLIGAIRCRIFDQPPSSARTGSSRKDGSMLYLSTLVLLSPYRSYGIATRMLDIMIKRAVREHKITSVGAHVWEANEEGLEWYRKRGFREVGREEGYYRRLKPSTAWVMQRDVSVLDLLND
jgi:N-alpha-acetyltransferase 50